MRREKSNAIGAAIACVFCGLNILAVVGWTYMFLNETYATMSTFGGVIAVTLGIVLIQPWVYSLILLVGMIASRKWNPHPAWIVICAVMGAAGSLATLMGWVFYIGQGV